jgi:hypothetical protein
MFAAIMTRMAVGSRGMTVVFGLVTDSAIEIVVRGVRGPPGLERSLEHCLAEPANSSPEVDEKQF